ncbi:MAG: DNA-directed RNA polymerase subunit alpha [candidate division WWE3 bacterium GW2011_GWC1_41_7]|uniref:DNA-directed RNA polymerase subunit alpha n=3 Tax=Katanobacteria TaxID=422282 RepID=A0A0G1A681_UNCKA|nr:MAG: DNA-directed RNA polymerase subunit alpha [candidate division WWE3 bacterium GW2011_GWB1_41_6]KKS20833.1 MAG: DNA-directed RNA polymerase subunit alpha [candidate division WWE3 bacterium GW2011_GWC1_41_7]OGC58346.1 MAG: DNA-directed RNA polymerase subunit alpha [candidate division WWE3 bacterium RIFCSPLOWO2_01_FULL_41_9]
MIVSPNDIKITTVSDTGNVGEFSIEPLPTGFGNTLGNAIKRVLLTSLEGSAITQVKIAGADHQFTTVAGVKEDIVEVTLNLKKVRFINHAKEPVAATINKSGPGEVTAGDIEVSSEVQILNKKQHIATLADKKTTFKAELVIDSGVGYSPMEERQTSKIGVIILDALYSPVIKAQYTVEPTRFGKVINLDKINLTVETDGSITPTDAVLRSTGILREYLESISGWDADAEEEETEEEIKAPKSKPGKPTEAIAIEELPLPTRTINALKKQGLNSLEDIANKTDEELADIKNLGEKSINEIKKLLKKEGLR